MAEAATEDLLQLYEALRAELEAGVRFDADRARALYEVAGELCWLELGVEGGCLAAYEAAARVEALLEPEQRAALSDVLAQELRRAGRLAEARSWLEHALDLPEARLNRPWILCQLADLDQFEGRLDLAEEAIPGVVAAAAEAGMGGEHLADLELSLLELRMRIALQKGLPDLLARLLEDYETRVPANDLELLRFQARLLQARERFDLLVEKLEPAVEALRDRDQGQWGELQLYLAMAEAERARLRSVSLARAEELFTELVEREGVYPTTRREAMLRLAACRIRSGHPHEAVALLEEVRAGVDSLSASNAAWIAALEARAALATGAPAEVLAERMDVLTAAYDDFLGMWATIAPRPGGVGFLHNLQRRDVLGELVRLHLETGGREGPRAALEDMLRARALGSLAREMAQDEAVTLEEIQADLLAPERGALVYLPSTDRSFVFAVDRARVTCHELSPLKDWNPDRRSLAFALRQPPGPGGGSGSRRELERLAGKLARHLLPPEVQERVRGWSELYIEGLDLAGYLPFELLPYEPEGADAPRPLGMVVPIAYLPSLIVGGLLARRARESPREEGPRSLYLVAAPETTPPQLGDIPWEDRNADLLMRAYGRDRVELRTAREATVAVLRDPELRTATVLQLVLHGLYDPDRERPGGIAFEPGEDGDGSVWCEDVDALSGIPPLVFLAICSASRGPLRTGDDGVSHLGGSFFRAGASVVILSPVDLEFHATMQLSDVFHERLGRHGDSPARAMTAARRSLAEGGTYDHPYYHSAIHVVGLGHLPLFPAREAEGGRAITAVVAVGAVVMAGLAALGGVAVSRRLRGKRALGSRG